MRAWRRREVGVMGRSSSVEKLERMAMMIFSLLDTRIEGLLLILDVYTSFGRVSSTVVLDSTNILSSLKFAKSKEEQRQ